MQYINGTARVLIIYFFCLLVGQTISVGIGLLLDPYSKTVALSAFIPLYYAMYWIAWRVALFIGDKSPEAVTEFRRPRQRFPQQSRELAVRARGAGARDRGLTSLDPAKLRQRDGEIEQRLVAAGPADQ